MAIQSVLLVLLGVTLFGGILSGIPVMFALLASATISALLGIAFSVFDPALLNALPSRIFGIFDNQLLYSVPLFILIGKLLEHSGIAEDALRSMANKAKGSPHQLPIAIICLSVVIACSSGVVGATILMLATIAFPAMQKAGYDDKFSTGLICASGTLGQIVPPSIVLIILSDQISNAWQTSQRETGNFAAEPVTIGHLFSGAILPGLLLAFFFVLYSLLKSRNKIRGIAEELASGPSEGDHRISAIIALLSLLIVPLSIIFGFSTATEAASIGVFILLCLTVISGKAKSIGLAFSETVQLTGVIFGIIIAASFFALVFRGLEGDASIKALLTTLPGESFGALVAVMVLVFVLGFVLEFVEITYVVVPIAAPILFSLGIDPIWFAILLAVNLQMSFLTPPMGISLFYFQSVARLPAATLYSSAVPFLVLQVTVLICIVLFPQIATWLPSILI